MDPLSITASLIAVLQVTSAVISICYDYRQGQKHASREVIQLLDELNNLRDVLDSLLRLVENSSDYGDEKRLETFGHLARPDGPISSCQEELEKLRKKLEPQSGWRAVKKSLVWPLQEGEMRKALDGLERLKSTMQLALSADQTVMNLVIREKVGDLTRLFERHSADQNFQDVIQWLAAPDPNANHVASRKKRQLKSGEWFLNSKLYEVWLHGDGSFLWLYGIPGSGKTVLCSTIIDHISEHCLQVPKAAAAYFYFNFNDTGKRDVDALVRSLLSQLATYSPSTPRPLLEIYGKHRKGRTSPDENELLFALRSMILNFSHVYVVLDALDESTDCEEVLRFIAVTQEWQFSQLHIIASSREWTTIEEAFTGLINGRLCLQNSSLNKDINEYITEKMANDKTLTRWPPDIRRHIHEVLLAKGNGMFRWVVCQLDMLKRCMSVAAVKKSLTSLPRNLDETYDRILQQIDEFHRGEVMKVLQALIISVEPLSLEEIVEILAVHLDTIPPQFDPESRLLDPQSIMTMCSSLVIRSEFEQRRMSLYDNVYGYGTLGRKPSSTLRLAHASVADFLTQIPLSGDSSFHFSTQTARQTFACICITYLLNPEFANGHEREKVKQRKKDFPFLTHAVHFWPNYLERQKEDPDEFIDASTKDLLQMFFSTSKSPKGGNYAFWVGMLIPSSPSDYIVNTHPLYYAASYGLTEVVRIILETEPDIDLDQLGGRAHATALHVAVFRDHIDVVRLLLEAGADPNIPNVKDESPLYWATVDNGMVALLMQYGAGDGEIASVNREKVLNFKRMRTAVLNARASQTAPLHV